MGNNSNYTHKKNRKKTQGETMRLLKRYLHLVLVQPGLLQAQPRKYSIRADAKFKRNCYTASIIWFQETQIP
jgi:hypothetical protein